MGSGLARLSGRRRSDGRKQLASWSGLFVMMLAFSEGREDLSQPKQRKGYHDASTCDDARVMQEPTFGVQDNQEHPL